MRKLTFFILIFATWGCSKMTDSEEIAKANVGEKIRISNSICGNLGYTFKKSVQNSAQFYGRKVHKSSCTKREDGLLQGYVYEFKKTLNRRYWVQLRVGGTRAIDLKSLNQAIKDVKDGRTEIKIKYSS